MLNFVLRFAAMLLIAMTVAACSQFVGDNRHNVPLPKAIIDRLSEIGSSPGDPMVIRVYKESSELEVWKRTRTGEYALLKSYPICKWSGELGPKVREGDYQSPEGFYDVTPALMNPKSAYWLSFNVGFPNAFDQAWGRTGTNLMVHGDCRSVGCFAMTDAGIKEIFALARETFRGGNRSFQIQLLPFRMTDTNMVANAASPHAAFWANLKEGTDIFDATKQPPTVAVCDGRYVFARNREPVAPVDPSGGCPVGSFSTMAAL